MKKIIVALLSALLLSTPVVLASHTSASVSLQEKKKTKKIVTSKFKVNMRCHNCVNKLNENLSFLKGVEDLKISLEDKTVEISYNPSKTDEATLVKAIEKYGYTVEKVE